MFDMSLICWIAAIPLFPLGMALLIALMKPARSRAAGICALLGMLASLVLALRALQLTLIDPDLRLVGNFTWLQLGGAGVDFGVILDPLSASMVAMVTFVGSLIFFYSITYMEEDADYNRFFCYLSLFAAGMLGLIVSNSLLLLFMCWEIVGLASYLLIGFWYQKPSAAAAAKKAFITTRIGDMGLFIGLLWAFKDAGTLLFYNDGRGLLEHQQVALLAGLQSPLLGLTVAGAVSVLIFIGAVGKSGQFPLHVWLPDAMEGPTPVSALIHAATMVAAGVFLVARTHPLFLADGSVLTAVAWVGGFTALLAGLIAVAQNDLKRILAYSTVSQLGMMMLGLGVGGVSAGMFHLLSHAFFKALLFLAAGSIIHGCHGEQDIRKLGGVARSMPVTTACYLIGTYALCALPFGSGYFSKDEILLAAWHGNKMVFVLGAAAAFCTSFYMTRQLCHVFPGQHRSHGHPHESSWSITTPLLILSVFALAFGGLAKYLGILEYLDRDFIAPHHSIVVAVASLVVALGGVAAGWLVYGRCPLKADEPDPLALAVPPVYRFFENRAYLDELYAATLGRLWDALAALAELTDVVLRRLSEGVVQATEIISKLFAFHTDRVVIDQWSFDGFCRSLRGAGFLTTRAQSGLLPVYLRVIALGAVVLGMIFWWVRG